MAAPEGTSDYTDPTNELTAEAIQACDPELVQYNHDITLHQACSEGKLHVIKYILSEGISDINCRRELGRTPVIMAAKHGQVDVFDFLVSQGSDLSTIDDDRDNVFHCACKGGNIDIVRTLVVSRKYDIESRGKAGRTPVLTAAIAGQKDVFDFIVSRGSDLTVVDNEKNTILHLASCGGNVDTVKYILSHNIVHIESRGLVGRTPVMMAAEKGKKEVFDFLVSRGSDLTVIGDQKNTILHVACIGGNVDIVTYILSHNIVDIESRGYVGRTPVMTAVSWGKKDVFDIFMSRGSDLTVVDDQKNTILHLACIGGNVDIVKCILSHNVVGIESRGIVGRTPVMIAVFCGKNEVFDFLMSRGSDLTVVDNNKNTILHLACYGGNVDIVKYILSHNIVDIESREFVGRTPVMTAAKNGKREVFDFLISKGSKLTTLDDEKSTILHITCMVGSVDMVRYLLRLPAVQGMEKVKNKYSRTPVEVAERKGHSGVVSLLKARI